MEPGPRMNLFGVCIMAVGVVLVAALQLWPLPPANGQDAHYWSNQYGTRSVLLGGTGIGSASDLGANYHNPGARRSDGKRAKGRVPGPEGNDRDRLCHSLTGGTERACAAV
jgi:hypothetical protein